MKSNKMEDVISELNEFSSEILNIILSNGRKELAIREIKLLLALQSGGKIVSIPEGLTWFGVSHPLSREELDGKLVILDFFTYCCMNCIHLLPHLKALEEKHLESNALAVIGVHSPKFPNEKDPVNLQNAIIKLEISHPVVNDPDCVLWNQLNIICWPTLVVLSPKGIPIFTVVGEGHHEELGIFVEAAVQFYRKDLTATALPTCQVTQPVASSILSYPGALSAASDGTWAIADTGHHRILLVSHDGIINATIGGGAGDKDGSLSEARFRSPQGVVFYRDNQLFVADTGNHKVRHVDLSNDLVTTVVGTGVQLVNDCTDQGGRAGTEQPISSPWGLTIVTPDWFHRSNLRTKIVQPSRNDLVTPSLPASSGVPPPPPPPPAASLAGPPPPPPPKAPGLPNSAITETQDDVKIADVLLIAMSGCHQIWAYFLDDSLWWPIGTSAKLYQKGTCHAVVGCGKEELRNNAYPMKAGLAQPCGIDYHSECDCVYEADSESSTVRCVKLADGNVSNMLGGDKTSNSLFNFGDEDGKSSAAKLQHPLDVAWHAQLRQLCVLDTYNGKLRCVNDRMESRTLPLPKLHEPGGICVKDGVIYIADTNAHRILAVTVDEVSFACVVKEVEIRKAPTQSKARKRQIWKTTLATGPEGVTLEIPLEGYHGRWWLQESRNIRCTEEKGDVLETARMHLVCDGSGTGEATIDFDLAGCSGDVCSIGYYRLLVAMDSQKVEGSGDPEIVIFKPDLGG